MGQKQENKSKRKKLRFKGLLIIILFCYLIISCGYYIYSSPVENISIEGNTYLKDNYIIDYLDISDKSLLKINSKEIKNKLLNIDLISSVEINKSLNNKITIKIVEEKILFYNRNTRKIVLSNGEEIDNSNDYYGIPSLINYVPSDIYDNFVKGVKKIDKETLSLISEIEYSPSIVNDKTVDENRFILRMNDGNLVYINTINIEKINNYLNIYEVIASKNENIKGCLYLDSNSDNNHFNNCESLELSGDGDGANTED